MKSLDDLLEPDFTSTCFVKIDNETGGFKPLTLADHYVEIENIALLGKPPENVRNHFERARNLFVYSWFVYDFTSAAIMQAHASVEMALRERFDLDGRAMHTHAGLRKMLKRAISKGWLLSLIHI